MIPNLELTNQNLLDFSNISGKIAPKFDPGRSVSIFSNAGGDITTTTDPQTGEVIYHYGNIIFAMDAGYPNDKFESALTSTTIGESDLQKLVSEAQNFINEYQRQIDYHNQAGNYELAEGVSGRKALAQQHHDKIYNKLVAKRTAAGSPSPAGTPVTPAAGKPLPPNPIDPTVEKYNISIKNGDLALNSGDFASAKEWYGQALAARPNDQYAQTQYNNMVAAISGKDQWIEGIPNWVTGVGAAAIAVGLFVLFNKSRKSGSSKSGSTIIAGVPVPSGA